jgi:exosortase A-associated hydrolase 1
LKVRELPLVFDCLGHELVGMVHAPEIARPRGLLFILAGASQYRGGMCRSQLQMAREWAAQGVPVMRFDHRGLGDSAGPLLGFRDLEADLAAALQTFLAAVPGMQEVVLFGGCDAASGTLINAWKFPAVTGIVLGNPWVHSVVTGDKIAMAHFSQRLRDLDFWLKFLRGGYNPLPAIATVSRLLWGRLRRLWRQDDPVAADVEFRDDPSLPHLLRMRNGLQRFKGDVLLLMSGRSLVSREFDLVVQDDPDWQAAMRAPRRWTRHDMPDADQAFSTIADRAQVSRATLAWLLDPTAPIAPAPGAVSAA